MDLHNIFAQLFGGRGGGAAGGPQIQIFDMNDPNANPFFGGMMGGRGGRGRGGARSGGVDTNAVGTIFRGDVPPMVWVQQQQRAQSGSASPVASGIDTSTSVNPSSNQTLPAAEGTAVPTRPSDPTAIAASLNLRQRGNRATQEGHLDAALELYSHAIECNPADELCYSNRALVYFKLNQHEKAVSDAKMCLLINPNFYKGYYRLGMSLMVLGSNNSNSGLSQDNLLKHIDDALEALQKALLLAPSESEKSEISIAIAKCESKRTTLIAAGAVADRASSAMPSTQVTAPLAPTPTPENEGKNNDFSPSPDQHFTVGSNTEDNDGVCERVAVPATATPAATREMTPSPITPSSQQQQPSASAALSVALEAALKRLNVETKPKVSFVPPPKLPELRNNTEHVKKILALIETIREHRDYMHTNHFGHIPDVVSQSLHFSNKFDHASTARRIIPMADMEHVSEAGDSVSAAQEALRKVAGGTNRVAYHRALAARDAAYDELSERADRAVAAVEAIALLAADAKQMSLKKTDLPQLTMKGEMPQREISGVLTSARQMNIEPLVSYGSSATDQTVIIDVLGKDEVQTLLKDLEKAEATMHTRLAAHVKRTDASAQQFLEALEAEQQSYSALGSLMDACGKIKDRLKREYVDIKVAQCTLGSSVGSHGKLRFEPFEGTVAEPTDQPLIANCYRCPPPVSDVQLEALASSMPRLKRIRSDVASFQSAGRRGEELLQLEAQLEHERLRQERHRIQLKADLEWQSVKEEEDLTRQTRLKEAIALAQQCITRIVDQQTIVHQELLRLINGDRPELRWSASAGGSKVLRWLKGSGLWLNKSFSDFQIVSTLASTLSSKVYLARTRYGEEITLKEVPIEDESKRKTFQNEINVMISVAQHPNVAKIQGIFFDGPFAYIVMPYYNAGSFKNFLATLASRHKQQCRDQQRGADDNSPSTALVCYNNANNDLSTTTCIPWHKFQELMRQVVGGIAFLHEKGVIHQDIKPSNILLSAEGLVSSQPSTLSCQSTTSELTLPNGTSASAFLRESSNVLRSGHLGNAPASPPPIIDYSNLVPAITDFGIAKDIGQFGEKDFTLTAHLPNRADATLQREMSRVVELDDDATTEERPATLISAPTATTALAAGTFEFMAPERQSGTQRHATPKSDIWSLGMTIYAIAATNTLLTSGGDSLDLSTPSSLFVMPFLGPNDTHISVDQRMVGNNSRLADLLSTMLSRDPTRRPTAVEILAHPYFTTSQVEDFVSNKQLMASNKKMEAFGHFVHALRQQHRQPTMFSVVRSQMVESVTNVFAQFKEEEMLAPLFVVFRGEEGVDEGALTSEMFSLYLQQCVTQDRLLVASGGSEGEGAGEESANGGSANEAKTRSISVSPNAEYLPSSDPRIPLNRFNVLGRVLLKSLVERRNVPFHLSPVIFKYFQGIKVGLSDLESYDPSLAQNLKRLLIYGEEELMSASLDFSDISSKFLASWVGKSCPPSDSTKSSEQRPEPNILSSATSSPNDFGAQQDETDHVNLPHPVRVTRLNLVRDTPVTIETVRYYIQCRVEYELVGKREDQLSEMKRGFFIAKTLEPHLSLFTASELLMQITGHQHISPHIVVSALQFVDYPSTSQTPQHLKDIILGFSQLNLRRFLMLCTPHVVIPAGGLPAIKVQRTADIGRLPVGHGCVAQLDLPDYNDKNVLRDKLAIALSHVNDGFFVA